MKKTTQERDPRAAAKLRDLIREISVAMITTATPEGVFRSRPMITLEITEAGELWFYTSDASGKVEDIEAEHAVGVTYSEPKENRYVSVSGNASIVRDRAKVKEMWDPALKRFFPQGLDDPHLALLCVRIATAEYWDATSGEMRPFDDRNADAADSEDSEDKEGGDHTRVEIRATPSTG